jgi:hypothetical protein
MYAALATTADIVHLGAMLAWGLGLPLLFWHRWRALSLGYTWFALGFVVVSQISHVFLGECFLTTLSRALWEAAGDVTVGSFTARLVNAVAGFRPSEQAVVVVWELGIVATSVAMLWSLYRHRVALRPSTGTPSQST